MQHDRAQSNEWMRRAASGDNGAFGKLAAAVQDDLFRLALGCGLAHADAVEVVQETLLRGYRRRGSWQLDGDAAAWLHGIAMNVAREFRRKRRRLPTAGLDANLVARHQRTDGDDRDADSRRLVEALHALPPRQREALVCRFLLGMSVRRTAATMGCAEGTVKASVFAAMQNLRKMVAPRQ